MARRPAHESAETSGRRRTPNYNWSMQLLGTSSGQATDVKSARAVRDAGVGSSPEPFDETLPFPPPPHRAARRSVEREVVEREVARGVEAERRPSGVEQRGLSLEQLTEASLARAHAGEAPQPSAPASETPVQAALSAVDSSGPGQSRLQWRGRELSPEFHEYARRVSRGENLEPFRGKLLADESQPLPWESGYVGALRSKKPRAFAWVLAALALVLGLVAVGTQREQEQAPAWAPTAAVLPPLPVAQEPAPPAPATAPPAAASSPSAAAEVTRSVSPPSAAPAAAPAKPRKLAAPAPAPAAPGASVLLVEKPPF